MSSRSSSKSISTGKLLLIFIIWAFAVLLFLSPDSPLFELGHRVDSAWFFMEGKALMNGLRPYVDFSDCKGPLLWLIYGIGYLISPRNYLGMYIVGSLFYAGTLFFNFKTARVFLKTDGQALAATLPMIFVYFFPWFHYEVRSEDLMLLFISMSMYILFKRLYAGKCSDKTDFFLLGFCFMALTMIKFNISAVQGVMVLIALWHQHRRGSVAEAIAWLIAACIAVALPFMLYLSMKDSLGAFFHDYFLVAFQVVAGENSDSMTYLDDLRRVASDWHSIAFIIAIIVGGLALAVKTNHYRLVPLVIAALFVAVSTRHNVWNYYYGVCYVFILYFFVAVLMVPKKGFSKVSYWLLTFCIVAACLYGTLINGELRQNTIFTHNADREAYYQLTDVLEGTHNAKLLNYESNEFGFGTRSEALPAGAQYACQNGSTPEMQRDHKALLHSGKADFVITYCREDQTEKKAILKEIEDAGYELRTKAVYLQMPFYVYSKKK